MKGGSDKLRRSPRTGRQEISIAKEIETDVGRFIDKSLSSFLTPQKSGDIITSRTPATVTRKVTEDIPKQRIIEEKGRIKKKKCQCEHYYEVRSVTASLSHIGYLPFNCDEEEEPNLETRYLAYRVSGYANVSSCSVSSGSNNNATVTWEVDPFTEITCRTGDENVSSPCNILESCSKTQKRYSCPQESVNLSDPCITNNGSTTPSTTISLSKSYTIDDVADNVDKMFTRVNPFGNDGVPAGKKGIIINDSNSSILTWSSECSTNRASFESGDGGVSKTKLYVKFFQASDYSLIYSNGRTESFAASAGQQIEVDPPDEPNSWIDIEIYNRYDIPCCNTEIDDPEYSGQIITSTFTPEEGAPPLIPFTGPDCKKYLTVTANSLETKSCSTSYADEYGSGSSSFSSTRNSSSTTIASYTQFGVISNQSETYSAEQSESGSFLFEDDGTVFVDWTWSSSSSITLTSINGASTCSGSYSGTFTDNSPDSGNDPSTTTRDPCEEPSAAPSDAGCISVDLCCKTSVSGPTITVTCTGSGSAPQNLSTTVTSTSTTTYSGLVTSQDQLQSGTWEEESEDNDSLCASRTESFTTKERRTVSAKYDVFFEASTGGGSIQYEHIFHYYTIETDNSDASCSTIEVVAHNEKWTSSSSGGREKFTKEIYLSTPAKGKTICAYGPVFITRPL